MTNPSAEHRSARRAAAWGVLVVIVYLISAVISGRMSIVARRPLLDGVTPPPPYRYVNPPPDAASQEKPAQGTFSMKLEPPDLGAGVFSTSDQQATLVSEPGIFPSGTEGPVTLTIEPLDPAKHGRAPKGFRLVGNVYRFEAKAKNGTVVGDFANPGHLVLVYPVSGAAVFTADHALLASDDGRSWRRLEGSDSPATQQISGDVERLGYFAVGESGGEEEGKGAPVGVIVGAVAGGLAVVGGTAWYVRERRNAARRRARARPRKKSS